MKNFYHCADDKHEIAFRFARTLSMWLTEQQIAEVNCLNATPEYATCCATHDFCDPNQAMLDVLAELKIKFKPQSDKQIALLDAAWSIAKTAGFDSQKIYEESQRVDAQERRRIYGSDSD